jgi:lysophospholipase L1-like esterase
VPVADVYKAFNGPAHLEDPVDKGYMPGDNIHPSDAGRAVIAETLERSRLQAGSATGDVRLPFRSYLRPRARAASA